MTIKKGTNENLSIVYFAAPSKKGEELYTLVKEKIESVIPEDWDIEWECVNHPAYPKYQYNSLKERQLVGQMASLTADLVIFDGSIDEDAKCSILLDSTAMGEGGKRVCSQYEYAFEPMRCLDHVLIVSRTQLPYNFEGLRKGGAPGWIRAQPVRENGPILKKRTSIDNLEIAEWVAMTVKESNLRLPRDNKLKEMPGSVRGGKAFTYNEMEAIEYSQTLIESEYANDVFVSYRSNRSRFRGKRGEEAVETLLQRYAKSELEGREEFLYYPPGNVSNEIMTEERRWEIVSMVDRQMRMCGTVLVFQTDDYDSSWWTMAEKICLSYALHTSESRIPRVCVLTPSDADGGKGGLALQMIDGREELESYLPRLSTEQIAEISRRFAFADPYEASHEYEEIQPLIADAHLIMKDIVAGIGAFFMWAFERTRTGRSLFGNEPGSLIEHYSRAKSSFKSLTWKEEFRKGLLFDCPKCREEYELRHPGQGHVSVDEFIGVSKPYTYRLRKEALDELQTWFETHPEEEIREIGEYLECPHEAIVRRNGHYYRFLQPRFGKVINSDGLLVKTIPVFEIEAKD